MPYEVEFNEELETLKLEKKSLQEQNDLLKELVKVIVHHLQHINNYVYQYLLNTPGVCGAFEG